MKGIQCKCYEGNYSSWLVHEIGIGIITHYKKNNLLVTICRLSNYIDNTQLLEIMHEQ